MKFKTLKDADLKDKRVIIRVDFNVPLKNGMVFDDFRIRKVLPTLEFLKENKIKSLIISHMDDMLSLEPVFDYLSSGLNIKFAKGLDEAEKLLKNSDTDFVLLENLRRFKGEIENDGEFAKKIASLGDVFINEAFSVSHRKHASIVGIPKFLPSFAGFLFEAEVKNLSKALNPKHPFIFILGGAKFDTKMPLVLRFLNKADKIFIGGALANDVYKAKGYEIGVSSVSDKEIDLSQMIESQKIITSPDVTVFDGKEVKEKKADEVLPNEKISDNGEEFISLIKKEIENAKLVLWNGPLGKFEDGFTLGTEKLAKIISESKAETIVGGGDTLSAISKLNLEDKFSFVSTGGGAMLDFLANETLPGIEALGTKNL